MDKNTLNLGSVLIGILLLLPIASHAQGSLYQDIKANSKGDILTVILTENISGSTNSNSATESNAQGSAGGSVSGNFIPFEPTFGSDVSVDYGSDARSDASQGQLLEGYMSVRIAEVVGPGQFVIEGTRTTEINGEVHEMNLKGIIRQQDINRENRIASYKIGNAEIKYSKKGGTHNLVKKEGFIKRVVFAGVGAALGAVAIIKAMN